MMFAVEGVLAHEVAHITNGDMVTMTAAAGNRQYVRRIPFPNRGLGCKPLCQRRPCAGRSFYRDDRVSDYLFHSRQSCRLRLLAPQRVSR